MAGGVILGALGLLLLASTANSQRSLGFAEVDYEVPESFPENRELVIAKEGVNIGVISISLRFLTLQQFRDLQVSQTDFNIQDLDPAEIGSVDLPDDFDGRSQDNILSFQPSSGGDSVTIPAPIISDEINEATEGFFVSIAFSFEDPADVTNYENNIVRNGLALVRIVDDDELTFGFVMEAHTVNEDSGDTIVNFGKVNNEMTELNLTVMVNFDILPNIISGTDFTLNGVLPMEFLFQPSDQFLSLTVTAIDDNILEGSENFFLTLFKSSSAVANINFDPSITEFTIIDNENIVMGFTDTEITVSEDDGTVQVGLEVLLPAPNLISSSFTSASLIYRTDVFTANGSATDADDFESAMTVATVFYDQSSSSLAVTPDTFNVMITDDNNPEGVEEFTLNLRPATPAATGRDILIRFPNVSRIIIQDNDATPSFIGFEQALYATSEDIRFVEICASILEPADLSSLEIRQPYLANLTFSLNSGTAQVVEDYINLVVDFSLSPSEPRQCFNVTIIDDDILEVTEDFRAFIDMVGGLPQNASLNITEARVDITDNELNGQVGFEIEDIIVTEGTDNFAIVAISFLSPTQISVDTFTELSLFTQDGTQDGMAALVGSDYTQTQMTIVLLGDGEERQEIMIPILNDNIVENSENFTLNFTVISDSGNIPFYQPSLANIQIIDDDVPTPTVIGLEQSVYMFSEGDGFAVICAAILEPGDPSTIVDPLYQADFIFTTTPDSALEDEDYSAIVVPVSLTPMAARECFDVPINNDMIFELTEYFNVSLALEGTLPAAASLDITRARVHIIDDEVGVIGLRNESFMVNESDGSITVYVEFLSPDEISADIIVDVIIKTENGTAFGGSDYGGAEESFTLQGESDEIFDIILSIINDDDVERPESEVFTVTITSSSPLIAEQRLVINPGQAVVTIIDDDDYVPSFVGFEQPEYNTSEDDSLVEICAAILEPLIASLLHDTYQATFNLSLASGTARVNEDFGDFSTVFSLTPTNPRQCFNITITDDTVLETPEDFFGSLVIQDPPPPAISFGDRETRVVIFDNEDGIIGFRINNNNVFLLEPDGPAMLLISFLSPDSISSDVQVTLTLSTADDTAFAGLDYNETVTSFSLSGGGNEMTTVDIGIINDNMREVPDRENFTATLTVIDSNVPLSLNPQTASVTILDDDEPIMTVVGFEQASYSVNENSAVVEICAVILSPSDLNELDPSFQVFVLFSVESGDAIVIQDFANVSMVLEFTSSISRLCVNVSIVDDTDLEGTEGFLARLEPDSALPDGVQLMPAVAPVAIFDNEVPSIIGFENTMYEVGEGDGVVEICVAILEPVDSLTLDSTYEAFINVFSLNDSAQDPDDFDTFFEAYLLTPSDPRACFNITIQDDDVLEPAEYLSVTLDVVELPPAATLNTNVANVRIEDNDRGQIGIFNTSLTVTEDVGSVTIYIGFMAPSMISENITADITFFTDDGNAIAGEDYTDTRVPFTLQGGGIMEIFSVDIPILHNGEIEGNEDFMTRIVADPLPERIDLDPDQGTVIITDVPLEPSLTIVEPSPSPSPPVDPVVMGGDPHYSIMLPSGQLLCFSVHGEKNFPFNLISNNLLQINAFFIEDALRDEITWIGSLGVVVQHTHYKKSNTTKIRFEAKDQTIYINNGVSLHARKVEKLTLANGKLTISEAMRRRGDKKPEVEVNLVDAGLAFSVRFVKKRHLDMTWKKVDLQPANSHGLIGQFMRKGVEIDETRKLLYLPSLAPVPVMRSSVWHFMERENPDPEQKLCWQAMNPGYQGKRLIEGSYLDYLVDNVLSSDFQFNPKSEEY